MTHADIYWIEQFMDIDDGAWCHGTVDTDCFLAVLIRESFGEGAERHRLAEEFERLSVDREVLLAELRQVRPSEQAPSMFPLTVRSETGDWIGQRVPTARFVLVGYRVRDAVPRKAQIKRADREGVSRVDILHGLLGEDEGPAARAFAAVGLPPGEARRRLQLTESRPAHILPALWPPPRQPREFTWPEGTSPRLVAPDTPAPSAEARPSSFVWTSEGQELELSAVSGGPIRLRSKAAGEVTIEICAEAAELIARFLENFLAQLNAERWEAVFEAERRGLPKPPLPRRD